MTKELSIKSIKKEIIDKLMNNMDILNYFKEYTESKGFTISELYDNFIFDYDSSSVPDDYITVEVSEFNSDRSINITNKKYSVVIKMGLQKEKYVCDMATKIVGIIDELYPDKKKFSNTTFKTMDNCISVDGYSGYTPLLSSVYMKNERRDQLHRMITFEIE